MVHEIAVGDRIDQPVGDLHRARLIGMVEQDREFVAAKPRDEVGLADRADHQLGKVDQRRIARRMAERIVEIFEPVDIDEQQRRMLIVTLAPGNQHVELADQPTAVGNRHQRIVMRLAVELLAARFEPRDLPPQARNLFHQRLGIDAVHDSVHARHTRCFRFNS